MASVCSGSLVHAEAGLLRGRPATTHRASLNLLSEIDPTVITDLNARFVEDGDLLTSAGVSAGIDMDPHLVARLAGTERPVRSVAASSTTHTHRCEPSAIETFKALGGSAHAPLGCSTLPRRS